MDSRFIIFLMIILTIYFTVGMLFTMMLRLGIGIVCFISLLYIYYSKKNYISRKINDFNPIVVYRKRKKDSTYKKIKKVWAEVLEKYHSKMVCPYCGIEITIFSVDINGKCKTCGNRLV